MKYITAMLRSSIIWLAYLIARIFYRKRAREQDILAADSHQPETEEHPPPAIVAEELAVAHMEETIPTPEVVPDPEEPEAPPVSRPAPRERTTDAPRVRRVAEPADARPARTSTPRQTDTTPRPARTPRKKESRKEQGEVNRAVSAVVIGDELRGGTRPRKRDAGRKSRIGEMMERALTDAAFFPAYKNWPVLDLCLYGVDLESDDDDDDDDGHYIKLFPANKWVCDLARPLSFNVLKAPGSDEWKSAYAMGLLQQPKTILRGRAVRVKPFEKSEIGPRVRNHKFKEQKYSHPYDRAINYPGLEVFTMQVFGDPSYFSKHGAYRMQLAVSPYEAFALADTGVLLRLDRDKDDLEISQRELITRRIRLSCGMQLAAESSWRVVLQYQEDRPKVAFMANAEMVRELLSLRKCSDKVKKKRMIHIVSSHMRRIREETDVKVMRHYRGSTETLWNGCAMQIVPPIRETDLMVKMTAKIEEVRALTETIQPSTMVA